MAPGFFTGLYGHGFGRFGRRPLAEGQSEGDAKGDDCTGQRGRQGPARQLADAVPTVRENGLNAPQECALRQDDPGQRRKVYGSLLIVTKTQETGRDRLSLTKALALPIGDLLQQMI